MVIWKIDEEKDPGSEIVVSEIPVRVAKLIERKEWLVTASDDMHVSVFSYHGKK